MTPAAENRCEQTDRISLYALRTLPVSEALAVEAHMSACANCRQELAMVREIIHSFVSWPTAVLRPAESLWDRLAQRIAKETGGEPAPRAAELQWSEPEWEEVAPGICCKLLATDTEHQRVTMLVRLGPNVDYPPHSHAGIEELHLLQGELWIDDQKLYPGDYNRAEPGTSDKRVWSETGCTCVLITSPQDILR
jgi:anti-sigma factor ChrR (cupin superfamily)